MKRRWSGTKALVLEYVRVCFVLAFCDVNIHSLSIGLKAIIEINLERYNEIYLLELTYVVEIINTFNPLIDPKVRLRQPVEPRMGNGYSYCHLSLQQEVHLNC